MDLIMWWKEKFHSDGGYCCFPEFSVNRTIRILFPNKNWIPAFQNENYEQYGTVRLRRYDKEDNHLCCLIEFEDKAVVDKILLDGYIYINDQRIKVKAMSVLDSESVYITNDSTVQPFDNNGQSLNNDNTFNLTGLNDDCLRFIFRKLHLSTLRSVADTCVRFKELAVETFRLKYKQKQIRFCDIFTNYPIPLLQFEAFLKMFGSSIHQIYIGPHEFNYFDEYRLTDVLLLISGNCPNLKVLDMRKLTVNYATWNECLSLFSQLESLKLTFANNDMNYVQPTVLPKLTSFEITTRHYEYMQSLLLNDWPLEELSIRSLAYLPERSESISQLTLAHWSNVFRLISEHCASVKKLSIIPHLRYYDDNNFSTDLLRLSELKNLRHLRLNFNLRKVRPLFEKMLQNNIQLEILKIERCDIGADGLDIISQFKTITTLSFIAHCDYDLDGLIGLVKRLPILSKLSFCTYDLLLDLSPDHIDVILPIVSNAKQLSDINISITTQSAQYTDEKYEELLSIVKKRVIPVKLKVNLCTRWYGPRTVAHFSEKKSNPDLLTIKVMY